MSDLSGIAETAIKVGGWVVSAAMFVWIMSRRTQGWDRGNQAWLNLHGDKESKDATERSGFIESYRTVRKEDVVRFEQIEDAMTAITERVRGIQDGLGAHGSRSDVIAAGVRKSASEMAREAADARSNRRKMIDGQYFPDREPEVDPPQIHAPRPDPRRDPDEPFRPNDTGRHRALVRKKTT